MTTRDELTRQAERSLRQGRVDEAIAQYQELAHLAPVDWGVVKQLADLLERAGQHEGAARQFARWADYLSAEGFHSKAGALFKKALKLCNPSLEHALWQLGEVSLELKLQADARLAFQRVADLRQRRGDAAGAAAARARLARRSGCRSLDGVALCPGPGRQRCHPAGGAVGRRRRPGRAVDDPSGRNAGGPRWGSRPGTSTGRSSGHTGRGRRASGCGTTSRESSGSSRTASSRSRGRRCSRCSRCRQGQGLAGGARVRPS